ncbi:hypothetical protein VUR80DRAFT_8109 [Thermomyces stellatus]
MNRYWIPQMDIHKRVLTQELQFHLGPEATVRPFTREGEDGFLITTPGACLTDEQIDDICIKSRKLWERLATMKAKENPGQRLKRPLHQPILVSKARNESARRRRRREGRKREMRGRRKTEREASG